jgi:VanZ family protein
MTESRLTTAPAPEQPKLVPARGGSSIRAAGWALAIAGLIFYASSRSNVVATGVTRIDDKFAHFAVYGLLGTLVCRIGGRGRFAALGSCLLVAMYAASDEWHQSFVPGRFADVGDWIADTLGAAVAIGLYTRWAWYRQWLERPLWSRQRRIDNS